MKVRIIVMCWIAGKQKAHEVVALDEDQLLEVLRGAKPSVFKTPPDKQVHWELREVNFS